MRGAHKIEKNRALTIERAQVLKRCLKAPLTHSASRHFMQLPDTVYNMSEVCDCLEIIRLYTEKTLFYYNRKKFAGCNKFFVFILSTLAKQKTSISLANFFAGRIYGD